MAQLSGTLQYCLVALLLATACSRAPRISQAEPTLEDLLAIISASDPASPQYESDPYVFAAFGDATEQLLQMGTEAAPAAPALAHALAFPRRDSYMAARPLVALGPQAANALPILIDNLTNDREDVRLLSAYVVGTIGPAASCATLELAQLLWDTDPFVRTAAAAALEAVTGNDLVDSNNELDANPASAGSVLADDPDGTISDLARRWWLREGSTVEWHPTYDVCSP